MFEREHMTGGKGRVRERMREREREADSTGSREPYAGLNPRTLGS